MKGDSGGEGHHFLSPPWYPKVFTRMGQRRSPDTPGLKIFGAQRGRGLDEMTFRVPPYFRGPTSLSKRNPGHSAGGSRIPLPAAGLGPAPGTETDSGNTQWKSCWG